MNAPHDDPAPTGVVVADDGRRRRTAVWVLAVQCLLALSWTLYVVFLPALLAAGGIDRRWLVYVLIADQVIFAASDWAAGAYADRVAAALKRTGRLIVAFTMVSSATLLAMPWVAAGGNAGLLLATIFLWVATSSALRAPAFALLARVSERRSDEDGDAVRAGLVSLALVGISLGGAVGPFLTMLLKNVDSRLPLAVSAVALAVAGLWATRAESLLPRASPAAPGGDAGDRRLRTRRAWSLAGIVLVAAFGTQIVTALAAPPLFQRFVGADAPVWVAWFWIGFTAGLVPGRSIAARTRRLHGAAIALVVALVAFAIGLRVDSVGLLVAATFVAGAGWGVFTTVAFSVAVSLSAGRATTRGAGTASGLLFSAFALATVGRLALLASGRGKADFVPLLPGIAWAVASVALVAAAATIWRVARTTRDPAA